MRRHSDGVHERLELTNKYHHGTLMRYFRLLVAYTDSGDHLTGPDGHQWCVIMATLNANQAWNDHGAVH